MKLLPIGLGLAAIGLVYFSTRPETPKAGGPPAPAPPPAPPPFVPPPAPANVDVLRQEVAALLAQAAVAPQTVSPAALDALALELDKAGLKTEAAQVRAKSAELKAQIPIL